MPEDIILIYSGHYNLTRRGYGEPADPSVQRLDGGDWLAEDFVPFVAHLDWDGQPDDTFFDSFLFLGLKSARGRDFAGERGQENASLWADWLWYIDRIFTPQHQLDALNTTVAQMGAGLGDPGYRVNVYIMIPYPSYLVTDFGHPDGSMGGESLLPVENRERVVRWYVDQVLERWDAWQPEHLNLAGFYWLQEHINPAVPDEESFVRNAVAYVQSQGYKIGWIPWSGAYLAPRWRSYGFDWAIIQPNHMFREQPNMIQAAAQTGRSARMGIEIELDGSVKQAAGRAKLYDYLDGGVEHGYMSEAMLGYYQDLNMLAQLYYEENGRYRELYDDIYAFAKGTYPHPTPAAAFVRGVVTDEQNQPIEGARIEAAGRTTFSDATGAFTLHGLYTASTELLIMADGYNPTVAPVQTSRANAEHLYPFILEAPSEVAIHTFDSTDGLGRIGVNFSVVDEPWVEGDGAVKVTLSAGTIRSLRITPSVQDWSRGTVMAVDVQSSHSIRLQMTLRDRLGATYTRSFSVEPDGWHTLAIPLSDAQTGRNHEPLVPESIGIVDVSQINLVTVSITGGTGTELLFDHLRLLGGGE